MTTPEINLPPIPEALIIRRSAHGFSHTFTAQQMQAYGQKCREAAHIELDALRVAAKIALDAICELRYGNSTDIAIAKTNAAILSLRSAGVA